MEGSGGEERLLLLLLLFDESLTSALGRLKGMVLALGRDLGVEACNSKSSSSEYPAPAMSALRLFLLVVVVQLSEFALAFRFDSGLFLADVGDVEWYRNPVDPMEN